MSSCKNAECCVLNAELWYPFGMILNMHRTLVPPLRGLLSAARLGVAASLQFYRSTHVIVRKGSHPLRRGRRPRRPAVRTIETAYRRDVRRPSPTGAFAFTHVIVRKGLHPLRWGRRPRRPACRQHPWCIPAGCPEAIPYGCFRLWWCVHACRLRGAQRRGNLSVEIATSLRSSR